MSEEKVLADWRCELWVHCPHCEGHQDVFDEIHEQGLQTSIKPFSSENIEYVDFKVKCEDCDKEFKIQETQW